MLHLFAAGVEIGLVTDCHIAVAKVRRGEALLHEGDHLRGLDIIHSEEIETTLIVDAPSLVALLCLWVFKQGNRLFESDVSILDSLLSHGDSSVAFGA